MRTFTIELRIDDMDKSSAPIIEQAAKVAAKHLFTQAVLVSARRKPQIKLMTSDSVMGAEELDINTDGELLP